MKYDTHWDSTGWADSWANVQQLQAYSGPSPHTQLQFLSNFLKQPSKTKNQNGTDYFKVFLITVHGAITS